MEGKSVSCVHWNSFSLGQIYILLYTYSPAHPTIPKTVLFISYLNKQFDGFKKSFVSRFQHPNILELAAYFTESEKFCLVYPYMRNGSLFDRLQCVVSYIYYSAWYSDPLKPWGSCWNTWAIVCCATWWPEELLGPYSSLIPCLKWVYINYPYFSDNFYLHNFTQSTIQYKG